MVQLPSTKQLEQLRQFDGVLCLTVYVPYIKPNAATNPNRIELKNLLHNAEAALATAGVSPRSRKKTLRPALTLLDSYEFWPAHHAGLALFMHPKLFRYYYIPSHAVPYLLTVQRGFNLDPLYDAVRHNVQYYVLALGHNDVRLYMGDHYTIRQLHLRNFPSNLTEALRIDEYPQASETHTIAPVQRGKESEAYHGQYNMAQTDKIMLATFFRLIDRRLHRLLNTTRRPLIIGGVKYLLPLYRKVNTYGGLLPDTISGSLEHASTTYIQQKAWHIAKHVVS